MSSTNKTTELGLNIWTSTDRPKMADFNADNAILEAYLIAIRQVPVLTINKAVISDGDGDLSTSNVTAVELAYIAGVTSAIQSQIDGKQDSIDGGASSITADDLTVNNILISDGNGKVVVSGISAAQLAYLQGVTSQIQDQLDAKQASINGAASSIASSNLTADRALLSNASGKVAASGITAAELAYLAGVSGSIQDQLNAKLGSSAKAADSDKWDGFHIVAQSAEPPGDPNVLWLVL